MNSANDVLSRLLSAQPMDQPMSIGGQMAQPLAQPLAQPQAVAQVATSDAERRRQEIAAREAKRQQTAREKLATRQSQMERGSQDGPQTPMESDNPRSGDEPVPPGYDAHDLFSGASQRAEDKIGSLDRKPMTEWNKSDWGNMLVDIGGGFANAKDGQFSSGLAGGVQGMTKGFKDQDERARKFNDDQRARMQAIEDMEMEDRLRQRRTGDERAYDAQVRQGERDYRSGERQQDRLYETKQNDKQRQQQLGDRDEQRTYLEGQQTKEREYASQALAAANSRADAKAMREAAAKSSRDYSSDYVKMATELNKARLQDGGEPMTAEELDAIILPQLRQAYGIGGLSAETQDQLPQNQTLGSGY